MRLVVLHLQHHPWRILPQLLQQRRQQHGLGKVVHRQAEAVVGPGIEDLLGTQPQLQQVQRLAHRAIEHLGMRGGRHATGGALEQGLTQLAAQPRQGVAHRGLAHVQARGGPRQVLLLHQGLEHQQQVQVDSAQIQAHE
ncbi:hypothetical protein D3C76_1207890 [compost metagenome]